MVGDNARFHLSYGGGEGPATVVGKFPTADEVSRGASVATRTYEVESRFYQELRHRVAIAAPTPHLALPDVEANDFVLILDRSEDRRGGKECVVTCWFRGSPYH